MNLSVIIVNYKSTDVLLDCLKSIYLFDTSQMEIIVVDNCSNDQCEEMLKLHYPQVRFFQMGYNAGFARANNAGIRIANGKACLLLNADTIILNDAINLTLNSFLFSDYKACGLQLLHEDFTPQISGNYAMRGGLNYLLPLPYLGSFLKFISILFSVKKPNISEATESIEVDWINGAFLMVKKDVLDKVGLLDEDFFLYAEEAEWCSRIRKQGKLCIYGQYRIIHLQGKTANQVFSSSGKGYFNLFDRKGAQIMLSNFVRIRKEFGAGWFFLNLAIYMLDLPFFFIGVLLEKMFAPKNQTYSLNNFLGFTKNIGIMLSFCPSILFRKPTFYKVI